MIPPALKRNERGGIAILLAGSMFMLAGAASVGVDLGSVYLAKRELQGVADATALAAATGGHSAATQLIGQSGVPGVSLFNLEKGRYRADPAIAVPDRFLADGSSDGGATRVEVRRRAPLFFGKMLVGRDGIDIAAKATAAKQDSAAFSLGTGLAALNGGVPNMLLSALAGTELNLSVMDTQGLADLDLNLLGVADALKVRLSRDGDTYGALFDREIPVSDIIGAMADASGGRSGVHALLTTAGRVAGKTLRLSDIVDLGPMKGAGSKDGQPNIVLDAFSMLRMVLSPPSGTAVPIDLRLTVPGLTATRVMLLTNSGEVRSPILTVTASKDVVLRTGQTRLYVETSVATILSGIASIRVPLYVELAAAEARLSNIDCTQGSLTQGVEIAVKPTLGTVALADLNPAALTSFSSPPDLRPVALASTLLGTKISAYANMSLGGVHSQKVHFAPSEIGTTKRVSTQDLSQGLATSVMDNLNVQVSVLGLTVSTSPLTPVIGGLLKTTAPLLDGVINSVTETLGVRLGTADVRVHDLRCGVATIVA